MLEGFLQNFSPIIGNKTKHKNFLHEVGEKTSQHIHITKMLNYNPSHPFIVTIIQTFEYFIT